MSKKIKWKNLPSTFRTCIIAMAVLLFAGLCLIVYGLALSPVKSSDVETVTAKLTSVDLVSKGRLDGETMEELREEEDFDSKDTKYEFKVGYSFTVNGKEETYSTRVSYADGEELSVGDTEELKYAVVNGKVVVNPDTSFTYVFIGILSLVAGAVAAAAAFILRPGKRKKRNS